MPTKKKLSIMVSSTVYGAEGDLDQVAAILSGYGYKVVMSRNGSVRVPIGSSSTNACLEAVKNCDLFLGIIFPRYGSGITHKEIKRAIKLNKPRNFAAHHYITFTREVFKQYMYCADGKTRNSLFTFKKTDVLDKLDVVDMYNTAIQNELPLEKRSSNWAQPFFKIVELFEFLETQYKDVEEVRSELKAFNKKVKANNKKVKIKK